MTFFYRLLQVAVLERIGASADNQICDLVNGGLILNSNLLARWRPPEPRFSHVSQWVFVAITVF